MKTAKGIVLAVLGVFVLSLLTIAFFQVRSYKTAMILAQIEKGKLSVSQKKAVDALNAKHKAEIAAREAEIAKISELNATAQAVIASIKVSSKAEIVALRKSSASWEVKFTTLEADYSLLLDKSSKQDDLIHGLKLEIGGIQEEVFTLKQQNAESALLYEGQIAKWKKQLAVVIRKASRSFGVVAGPVVMFGVDGKLHYGAGITAGWRLY